MKRQIIKLLFSLLVSSLVLSACSDNDNYEKLLEKEKTAISNYIKDNGISTIHSIPEGNAFGENEYFKTSDEMYIHISDIGDTNREIGNRIRVAYSYKKTNLLTGEMAEDTNMYGYKPEFIVGVANSTAFYANSAIREAVNIMKYHNSSAVVIVPSKLGDETDTDAVIPCLYELKIWVQD